MSIETVCIRERLQKALDGFDVHAALFTTFTFVPDFFEQNVLPILFGIEGKGRTRRRVQVNGRLRSAPVAVFYDMSCQPRGGGEFQYQSIPVKLDKGVFHPKLALIAGRDVETGAARVLVYVSSANLTLSAWARNEEVSGTFWVESEAQRTELTALLRFLERRASAATLPAEPKQPESSIEAIPRVREILKSLDGLSERGKGLPDFRCFGLRRRNEATPVEAITPGRNKWSRLTVFSPYWSNREDTLQLAAAFRTKNCRLVPAPKATGHQQRLGIDETDVSEHVVTDQGRQFRHAKLYVAEGNFRGKKKARITLGSANFTTAALGQGERGPMNVEAVVAYDIRPSRIDRVVPVLTKPSNSVEIVEDGISEDDDGVLPFTLFVVFDWTAREYRIHLSNVKSASDFRIGLPGVGDMALAPDAEPTRVPSNLGPTNNRDYTVHYLVTPSGGPAERAVAHGLITEIGLDESDHKYSPLLTLDEFFASWFHKDPNSVHVQIAQKAPEDDDEDTDSTLEGSLGEAVDQLDATNLFTMYQALRRLEQQSLLPARNNKDLGVLREFLVTRPDSVDQLARLLDRQRTNQGVRLALLLECARLFDSYAAHNIGEAATRAAERTRDALMKARSDVLEEFRASPRTQSDAEATLVWFEEKIAEAWA